MAVLRRLGCSALVGALLAACGLETAAPVNVDATVQARVSATVAAIARGQATPTRPPGATTVGPIGSPALSPVPNTTGVGIPFATAGPSATVGTPGATPSGGAGTPTPVRSVTSGGTPGTATAVGSPGATQTASGAVLALGAAAPVGGLGLTINRYEWNTSCPAGGARAGAGQKFVVLQAVGRNDGATAVTPTAAQWAVESVPAGSSVPCRPEGRSFDDACYRSGAIPPGTRCEGWLVFEVPEQLSVPGAVVTARVVGSGGEGRWRLPA